VTWGAFGINTFLVLGAISLFVFVGPWRSAGATGILAITPVDGRSLTTADADAVVKSVPGVTLVSRIMFGSAPIASGGGEPRFEIQAVDASYALLPGASLARGTFFTAEDALAANRVAVLGNQVASSLFPAQQTAVGQSIRIGNVAFTVVGVLAASTDAILIPFQTGQVRVFGTSALGEVVMQARDPNQTDAVVQSIQSLLRTRHQVRPGQPDDVTVHQLTASGTPILVIDRFRYLAGQYACQAKGLCGA
jgi:putative ABC transport system permease protein